MRIRSTDPDQRGAWTPFVGVALASLTAGSLILFSFVAQRTSLDAFTAPGVRAVSPSSSAPRSITLPAAAPAPQDGSPAGPLATLSPTAVVVVPTDDNVPNPATSAPRPAQPVAVAATDRRPRTGDDLDLRARFASGGETRAFYREAGLRGDAETTDADSNNKAKKNKKNKGKNPGVRRKGRAQAGVSSPRKRHHGRGTGHTWSHGSPNSATESHRPAAPRGASSSKPASPKPAPKTSGHSQPAGQGHSNTKGKGHSNGRGRGHAHD